MREYPRWIHHPQERSVLVRSAQQEEHYQQLSKWYDSPSEFPPNEVIHHEEHEVRAKGDGTKASRTTHQFKVPKFRKPRGRPRRRKEDEE